MIVRPTDLEGCVLLVPEPLEDERGFFSRVWCTDVLASHGLETTVAQSNIAYNHRAGTVRGLHFQRPPHDDVKVVRCTAGAVYDVVVDLRPTSETYLQWIGVELTASNRLSLYVPAGFAHGYQTLAHETETHYLHSAPYAPTFDGGVRWDDPAFAIDWPPATTRNISAKDRSWPDYDPGSPIF